MKALRSADIFPIPQHGRCNLAPLAGRGRIASSDAIRVRGSLRILYVSIELAERGPSPQPSQSELCSSRPRVRTTVCTHLERQSHLSSLRTQGPIPRDIRCRKESRPAAGATNSSLWLWVPAFAGTTASLWLIGAERCVHPLVRTHGLIPRDIRYSKESRPAVGATNSGLWLWVPAFAGTTASFG